MKKNLNDPMGKPVTVRPGLLKFTPDQLREMEKQRIADEAKKALKKPLKPPNGRQKSGR